MCTIGSFGSRSKSRCVNPRTDPAWSYGFSRLPARPPAVLRTGQLVATRASIPSQSNTASPREKHRHLQAGRTAENRGSRSPESLAFVYGPRFRHSTCPSPDTIAPDPLEAIGRIPNGPTPDTPADWLPNAAPAAEDAAELREKLDFGCAWKKRSAKWVVNRSTLTIHECTKIS